ncbi:MAG TPA: cysteine synthase family protein [Bryobacteraceae bacterium]|nr:cysteine synthase family protein [Bryobacteraceae bacterium]
MTQPSAAAAQLPDRNIYLSRLSPTPLTPVQILDGAPAIWCKLEFLNPSGSTKDRIARYILEKAWREGRLRPGGTVIEASSGSTSIAMALACAQLGLRFIAVMPEGVSNERVLMIRAYGGEIHLTPQAQGILGALGETERMAPALEAFLPRQFSNPDNANAHRQGTAREILDQIPGRSVDAVVSGVGTGGTLVGLYQGLLDHGCPVRPFLARPVNPIGLSGAFDVECTSFSSRIPGVVECVSTIFQESALPGLVTIEVSDEEAICTARELICRGFPVGPSSGLNYCAALIAARQLPSDARVVTVFPDRMERYFTTDLFLPFR